MKKKLVCALVVLAAFTIAACDNGGNKSQTQDSQQTKTVAPMDEAKQSMKDAGASMQQAGENMKDAASSAGAAAKTAGAQALDAAKHVARDASAKVEETAASVGDQVQGSLLYHKHN